MSVLNYLLDTLNIDSDELFEVDKIKIDHDSVYLFAENGFVEKVNVDTVPDQYIGSYKLVTTNGNIVLEK